MASRRITRETFEAVVQDKVKRYRDAAGDSSMHRFKAPPRPLPRPRYDADGRFNCQQEEWSEDPRDDYPLEEYPGETYPGPSYRPSSPLIRKENYFHGQFSRPAPRQREFGRDYGRPAPQNREFGRGAVPNREYGQQNREYGQQNREYGQQNREYGQQNREYGQQNREYGRDRDYGQDYCWEGSGQHEPEFGSSDVLGDFRSPGLMEEEFGTVENQEYEEEEEEEFGGPDAEFRLRRGNVGRGRVLRGNRLTRGVVKPKGFKGDLKSPLKKWNVKKAQPGLEGKALEQPLDVAERPSGQRPLQQHPKVPPSHPLAAQRPILRLPKPTHVFRNLSFNLVDKSDIFSTFGMEIIKWAGFHAIKNDAEFSRLFGALFELETETCAKMLASFKCSLRPEHRDYCFFTIKSLQHAALKTPKVDNEFLNMLLDKGAVKTKNCFFEIIKPFDKYIMRLQDRLLKGVTPLLMACNAYELSIKTNGFGNPREMANAFETTVSLCRKSLALLGQTFALASVFRQEKILEAVGLQEMAPAPTAFPNFDDSTLFGREYIENLKAWLEKSGYPIQMKKAEAEPTEQLKAAPPDSKAPQRADRKILDTIEQLVTNMVSGTLSAQDRNAQKNCPEYWFLSDEESLEYKYFRLRLAEVQRSSLAPESLRALLYARRVASIKRRLCKRKKKTGIVLRAARARRVRRTNTGTQTVLAAGTGLRQQEKSARISLPGPGGVTSNLPGPGGVTTNLPGPGGVTRNLPGPVGVTSNLPGPVGVTSNLPGPVDVTTNLPGPGGVTSNLPGPVGVTRNLPGAVGVTRNLPGPVGVTSNLPGPGGVTSNLPGPVGVTTNLPGPGGVTSNLAGPGGVTRNLPGPVGVTTNLPGPGGVTSNLPGPVDVTTNLPGPVGVTSNLPGPGGVTTNLPGPVDVNSNLPGPVSVTSNLPGPVGVNSNLAGPVGVNSNLAGPGLDVTSTPAGVTSTGGVTSALPGPALDVTSSPAGVTTNLPGFGLDVTSPGGVTSILPGPALGVTSTPEDVATNLPGPVGVTSNVPGPVGVTSNVPGPVGVTRNLPGPALGVTSTGGVTSALPGPALGVASALPGPVDVTRNLPGPALGVTSAGGVTSALPGPALDVTSSPAGVTTKLPGPVGVTSALPGPGPGVSSSQVPEAGEGKAEPEELLLPLGSQFPQVDAKTMETAEKLAKFVAQVGPEIEQFSIDNSADNPDLWFLQDQTSPAFKFYRMKVYELCPSITFTPETPKPSQGTPELSEEEEEEDEDEEEEEEEEAELEPPQAAGEEDEDDVAAGRRGAQLEEDLLPRPAEEVAPGEGRIPNPNLAPAPGAPFPRKRVSSKSLKVGMIPASKRICLIEEPKVHEPVRIAYDRPRGCPVTKKKKKAKELEFPQKRLSPRNKAKELEFPQKRLSPRNVGFQMLQRMGWQEGHGLGSRGRGIREPVHLGATSAGEGLGVAGEENQEDAFDIFRQRMIQMYRQKRANK